MICGNLAESVLIVAPSIQVGEGMELRVTNNILFEVIKG